MILSGIQSIKNRIVAIIFLVCTVTLGAGFTIAIIMDIDKTRKNVVDQAAIAAKLVGESCVSALAFDYPDKAEQNLMTLKSFPGLKNAWLYDTQGNLFAAYDTSEVPDPDPRGFFEAFHRYDAGFLHLMEPITYQEKAYGMIYLKISPGFQKEIASRMAVAGALMACLLFIAYLLANLTQKIVSEPILLLARTAARISDQGDYSIRLENKTQGEVGVLYRSFNGMLDTIQDREQERDAAEKSLLFKEQVIESSTSAVATADLYGMVTYSNPSFMKLFGYIDIANVVDKPFAVYLGAAETFDLMLTSLERQRQWTFETKARKKSGSLFDAIISADTILDEKNKPESIVITVSDISELRKTTREMERESQLKTGVQTISDRLRGIQEIPELATSLLKGLKSFIDFQVGAVYVPDETGTLILRGSHALYKDIDFTDRFLPGESLVGQTALDKTGIAVSHVPQKYFKISSGAGQAFPTHIRTIPFVYNDTIKGVMELGAFTPFEPMDAALLDRLNETVAIAIHTSQSNSRLQELLERTQSQSEELQTQTEEMETQQEELQATNKELEAQTRRLEEQQANIRLKNKELEESRWLVEQKVRDLEITGRYKSEFMANMSHELRTPLNSILLLSDVLSENKEKNLNPKQVEFSKSIYTSGNELLALINDILDLSKVESGRMDLVPEQVAISEFKKLAERTFEPAALEKGIQFEVRIEKEVPAAIVTDRQKVEQVLKNLLSNAVKFTDQGSVTMVISRPKESAASVTGKMNLEKAVAFAVQDTGIGIPEDKFSVVFEAFKQVDGTTSRKFGGTGLGLSISKEIARFLGGVIALESRPGKGSLFTFYLPETADAGTDPPGDQDTGTPEKTVAGTGQRPDGADPGGDSPEDDRYSLAGGDKTVLLIEDDAAFAKILRDRARAQAFKVIVADDGETGLHFADFYRPSAIILDLELPGIDGWSVMERLKNNLKTRHIPIHIISAAQTRGKAMEMGAVGFLTKPVSLAKLEAVFGKFNDILSKPVQKVLVVEDNEAQCNAIKDIIGNGDLNVTCTYSGLDARELLRRERFDCLILDLNLPDISGFEVLSVIQEDKDLRAIPVIVYTGKPLTPAEQETLRAYADDITVKGVDTLDRLLDETTLFLHRVESDLSEPNRKVLRKIYERESVLKGKRILLVDDDMRNVFAINNILEEKGIQVVIGKNGIEALACLRAHTDIDLVLMDMMMPEMDGYQAMQEIRRQKSFASLPIIALTARAMKGDRAKCIEAGANDYLSKPVNKDKLISMLRVWLYS